MLGIARRLGKLPAIRDTRIPRMDKRVDARSLPPPPDKCIWYAKVGSLPMLMNNQIGCCTISAVGHYIQQMTAYRGAELRMTDQEVVSAYSAVTGYIPGNPGTDNGAFMMGQDGVLTHWARHGIQQGGVLTRAEAFLRVNHMDFMQVRQAIYLFGGVMFGLQLPNSALYSNWMWKDSSGEKMGGHEVFADGYTVLPSGYAVYDLISWGRRFRATEQFLRDCLDEAAAVFDDISINERGVDARGVNKEQLIADMSQLSRLA